MTPTFTDLRDVTPGMVEKLSEWLDRADGCDYCPFEGGAGKCECFDIFKNLDDYYCPCQYYEKQDVRMAFQIIVDVKGGDKCTKL